MMNPEGFYQIQFAGAADTGFGVLLLESGKINGIDVGGVEYDGDYTFNQKTDQFDVTVKATVPPGMPLVTGFPAQPTQHQFEIKASLPNDLGKVSKQTINTPYGQVNVVFKKLRHETGSLYSSIKDPTLKGRCLDLLSAQGHFDRVINQATQVLEDRIRQKSGQDNSLTGTQLVNTVLKGDLSRTILKFSNNPSEQQGICDICRGIMQAFRNPSHHTILDNITREDALKVCAFIDKLLELVDSADINPPS